MKANILFFCTVASVLTIQSISPNLLKNIHPINGRLPASETIPPSDDKVNTSPAPQVACKSELKGEKLEADVKKSSKDIQAVIEVVENPKADKKAEVQKENADKKSDNSEMLSLMSQMTTLFTTQMQMQMQMQNQMLSMILQMQSSQMPPMNPYSPSLYSNYNNNQYGGYPNMNDSLGFLGAGVGIGNSSQAQPWSHLPNPYSAQPNMERNQMMLPSEFGFSFNQAPLMMRGFDFNQTTVSL